MQNDQRIEAILRRENNDLRIKLQEATALIASLRSEIDILHNRLGHYERSITIEEELLSTPKISKMQIQQHFECSSDEQIQNSTASKYRSPKIKIKFSPLCHSSNLNNRISSERSQLHNNTKIQITTNKSSSKKVIINEDSHNYKRKQIKILKKSSQRMKNGDISDSPYKAVTSRQIIPPSIIMNRQFSSVKSEKLLKGRQSRPIFQHFFVTGMARDGPCITYSFPHGSNHKYDGYLTLMYGQNSLRQADLSPSSSKSKIIINPIKQNPYSICIKDTFVIPIIKPQAKNNQKDYLIVCEIQENAIEKDYVGYYFPRYYCFLSQWKFFTEFRKLTSQFIDRIHLKKKNYPNLSEVILGKIIQEEVEQGLSFLFQKSIDYNKSLDCCIASSGVKFSAQLPPAEQSYLLIEKYQQWQIINSIVQFKVSESTGSIETQLFGVLLVYALAQMKIVLYSSVKSKISQAILQLLEVIKPLNYVNPILMATLKDQHQNYLDAPMSIILGLWVQQRKSSRQKIQIYMNKKMNLAGLIQKAVLSVTDGIVINLDTGLVFGAANVELIEIACKINTYRKRFNRTRQTYKMVEKFLGGRFENQQGKQAWNLLLPYLQKTQSYCYYLQNKVQ